MKKSWGYLQNINDVLTVQVANTAVYNVCVGTGATSAVVTFYNGSSTSDPVVATVSAVSAGNFNLDGAKFSTGLYAKLTGGAAKVTVLYR